MVEYVSDSQSVLARNYIVYYKIGCGSFGDVYQAEDRSSGQSVAVKLESADAAKPQLLNEYKLYKSLQHGEGIPQVYACYTEGDMNVMVMELLGPSLEDLFDFCDRRLSVKTVAMLAEQMIDRMEFVHSRNILHRDIKPDNFLMGSGDLSHRLFIIDFGLAKEYWDDMTNRHIDPKPGSHLVGTARYASINAMRGSEQSRRDDMEALGYLMMYMLRGSLPWQGVRSAPRKQRHEMIAECKQSTRLDELCRGYPDEFAGYLSYCRNLGFEETPHYVLMRRSFLDLMKRFGYANDGIFDWTRKAQEADEADEESELELDEEGDADAVE